MAKSLRRLLTDYCDLPAGYDRQVENLCLDSRLVRPGDLFIAKVGAHQDGAKYITEALANGAVAVLRQQQADIAAVSQQDNAPIIAITKLDNYLGDIAARFYDYPSRQLQVIGITGTNGKSSVCHMVATALNDMRQPSGIIGTLGHGLPGQLQRDAYTTPDAISLARLLADFREQQITTVAMEVSSHALSQGRVNTVEYETAVFTNLSRDHLDFHGSMQQYAFAKKRLFLWPSLAHAVINLDDPFGFELLHALNPQVTPYLYTLDSDTASRVDGHCLSVDNLQLSSQGIEASIITPWGRGQLRSPLLGRFNVANLLAVIAVLGIQQLPLDDILTYVAQLSPPPGRLQRMALPNQAEAVIDFAHTPDALMHVLQTLRELTTGRILCVFGCGGERDTGKRGEMGDIAERYADKVIITTDNPRHEDPNVISQAIVAGMQQPTQAEIILDRHAAIFAALADAKPDDIVLIAGKGHETVQLIGSQRQAFSDHDCVMTFIEQASP